MRKFKFVFCNNVPWQYVSNSYVIQRIQGALLGYGTGVNLFWTQEITKGLASISTNAILLDFMASACRFNNFFMLKVTIPDLSQVFHILPSQLQFHFKYKLKKKTFRWKTFTYLVSVQIFMEHSHMHAETTSWKSDNYSDMKPEKTNRSSGKREALVNCANLKYPVLPVSLRSIENVVGGIPSILASWTFVPWPEP